MVVNEEMNKEVIGGFKVALEGCRPSPSECTTSASRVDAVKETNRQQHEEKCCLEASWSGYKRAHRQTRIIDPKKSKAKAIGSNKLRASYSPTAKSIIFHKVRVLKEDKTDMKMWIRGGRNCGERRRVSSIETYVSGDIELNIVYLI